MFNEYGVVNDALVKTFDDEIGDAARQVFAWLAKVDVPATEYRAVCHYLVQTIETEAAEALLRFSMAKHKAKRKPCMDDSCDADHCPRCGGHKVGWNEPGLCQSCADDRP